MVNLKFDRRGGVLGWLATNPKERSSIDSHRIKKQDENPCNSSDRAFSINVWGTI